METFWIYFNILSIKKQCIKIIWWENVIKFRSTVSFVRWKCSCISAGNHWKLRWTSNFIKNLSEFFAEKSKWNSEMKSWLGISEGIENNENIVPEIWCRCSVAQMKCIRNRCNKMLQEILSGKRRDYSMILIQIISNIIYRKCK